MARIFKALLSTVLFLIAAGAGQAVAAPVKILAIGTSLTQGYGLPPGTEFTVQLQKALKQAGFFARTAVVPGAPHYWLSDPIDEPGSFSGFLAPRLVRFLAERL